MARFAELVFAYIDELSAASAAGHADELATTGRVRQRYLERLTQSLLRGGLARRPRGRRRAGRLGAARGSSPRSCSPTSGPAACSARSTPQTLQPTEQVPGLEDHPDLTVLLVPSSTGRARTTLLRSLAGREAVVGPARPWLQVKDSYDRALRVVGLDLERTLDRRRVDTEEHLPELILGADADGDARPAAPGARPARATSAPPSRRSSARRCASWLLHHGRRDEIAAELFVHPQTVRYRMQQLREVYGDRLEDPDWVLRLTLALA